MYEQVMAQVLLHLEHPFTRQAMSRYAIGWRCYQAGADTGRRVITPLGEFWYDAYSCLPIEKVEGPVYLDLANERVALKVLERLWVLTELLDWSQE